MPKKETVKKEVVETNENPFASMPIDNWMNYIEENGNDEEETRKLKVLARRSLTVDNMKAYILKNDNTAEAKHKFKEASFYTVKDENDNPIIDKDGKIVQRQSLPNAASYFVNTYLPDIAVETKKKASAFDAIADW
jgi:hypothetical protein